MANFTKEYASYSEAVKACQTETPYQDQDLLECILAKTKRYLSADAKVLSPYEVSLFVFLSLLQGKSQSKILNVIDVGGACGMHYFQVRKVLPKNIRLRWKVVETPGMVRVASELTNDELSFHDDLKAAVADNVVDGVFLSGLLQCCEKPWKMLSNILSVGAEVLGIYRVGCCKGDKDYLTVQDSRLSTNGPGELPEGFEDRIVKYPYYILSEEILFALLLKKYECAAVWDDGSKCIGGPQLAYSGFSGCFALKR